MGFFKPTAFFTGAAREGVTMFEEAEEIGKEGVSILKEAKEEVQKEIKTVSDNYDKAIALADSVGGGAFGKYLFSYYPDVDQLAGLSDLQPEDRTKALSTIKSNYDNLSEEDKARLTDGDFSEMVEKKYSMDVDGIKSGLIEKANMGTATANTLVGKVQGMVDKSQFAPQREAIISGVGGRELRESDPVEGGLASISEVSSVKPFLSLNYQDAKVHNDGFLNWFKSNYKDPQTNEIIDPFVVDQRVSDVLRIAGYDVMRDDDASRPDDDKINNILNFIASRENTTIAGAKEEIIRESYFDQYYGVGSYGDGYLQLKRNQVSAEQGQVSDIPLNVAEDFNELSLPNKIAEIRRVLISEYGPEASENLSDDEVIDIINQSQLG